MGRAKGFARHNGSYTDPHGSPKEMFVRPQRPDARARLAEANRHHMMRRGEAFDAILQPG